MLAKDVISILTKNIPRAAEWSIGEPYGAYNLTLNQDIQKILFCVTPTSEVIEYFNDNKYDLLISHHPMLADVPQMIFHTALDCCEGGLNDVWRDALEVKNAIHFDGTLGWSGQIEPIDFKDLIKKCEKFIGHKVIGQTYSEINNIESVVICSGLGGLVTDLARDTKADCYIIGEALAPANTMGFKAVIEIGHTLSERMGSEFIKALLPSVQVDQAPLDIDYYGREHFRGF